MEVKAILAERETQYGDFYTLSEISQNLKKVMRESKNWNTLSAAQKESLEMVVHKIARILNGNADYKDSWNDVAGYATLVGCSETYALGDELPEYLHQIAETI